MQSLDLFFTKNQNFQLIVLLAKDETEFFGSSLFALILLSFNARVYNSKSHDLGLGLGT